ncbi:flavodoxin I [Amphibacillus marinus]|uniref:Flavodoxin I n=1 Tax=Amphibacillus marinus TaxID=872970 RepID=A0A1H8RJA2_9BACI|nr:flavodoxin domain-containing protein [Amphibacillus marinus]SEO66248.1 flavodoxin I [Amphibacillus marinus]
MKVAIIYSSITGNTGLLAESLYQQLIDQHIAVDLLTVDQVHYSQLTNYDAIAIGTYTWDNGDLPPEMDQLFCEIEERDLAHVSTGIFGTGDSFYPYFCGAVDLFRDMLYVHTQLAVTLKVELVPQSGDLDKLSTFCNRLLKKQLAA